MDWQPCVASLLQGLYTCDKLCSHGLRCACGLCRVGRLAHLAKVTPHCSQKLIMSLNGCLNSRSSASEPLVLVGSLSKFAAEA